jgi:hypothetical protein
MMPKAGKQLPGSKQPISEPGKSKTYQPNQSSQDAAGKVKPEICTVCKIAQEAAGNAITFSSSCFGGKMDQNFSASSLETSSGSTTSQMISKKRSSQEAAEREAIVFRSFQRHGWIKQPIYFAAGAGVMLKASIRIFQSSPSRITDQ